ncbi:MAG: 30S ribosomal protein S8 [Planctomycetota bacterium]|nr:30S ribosomal protein S8 [Planctomycetota bacterium]
MTDPIADLFTRIRNAGNASRSKVDIPYSILKENIVDTLVRSGYLREKQVTELEGRKRIRAYLRLDEDGLPIIERIERVSKPGCRKYRKSSNIPRVLRGMGIGIYSTSRGVLTDDQCREQRVGGEYLGRVW